MCITPTLLSAVCQCYSYHGDIKIKGLLYQPAESGLIKMVEGAALEHTCRRAESQAPRLHLDCSPLCLGIAEVTQWEACAAVG